MENIEKVISSLNSWIKEEIGDDGAQSCMERKSVWKIVNLGI